MMTRNRIAYFTAVILAFGLSACQHEQPNTIFMPDMVYGPSLKAQEFDAMRWPVKGTIPRGFESYTYHDPETAGRELKNPLRPTKQVLLRGQAVFNTHCLVCHGPNGEGDGSIVPKFPRPPTLQSDKIRGYQDGSIFHVITMGQNLMPSYAGQVALEDRWAAIHYVRVLQRAKHPTAADLKAVENQ